MYDFDEEINRKGTHCVKWDMLDEFYNDKDLLSMWVADSDFKTPPAVVNQLIKRAEHGIFGYTSCTDEFYDAFILWTQKRHAFTIQKEWVITTPGVVAAINFAIQTFTTVGDNIIIQTPVYPPFFNSIKNNGRILIENPLIEKNGTYEMDFDHFENCIDPQTKMLILCNPHNPIGRVWTKEELLRLGEICTRKKILILSDEIHSDLILEGYRHTPMASLSEALLNCTISCYAPSKTFNVAGLQTSVAVIPNKILREKFLQFRRDIGVDSNNVFGIEAFTACYQEGEEWLEEQLLYIGKNITYINDFIIKEQLPLKAFKMEGTYLMWLDCRELNMAHEKLQQFFIENVKVALNSGNIFGAAGNGFMRVNLATQLHNIKSFMKQLKTAYSHL